VGKHAKASSTAPASAASTFQQAAASVASSLSSAATGEKPQPMESRKTAAQIAYDEKKRKRVRWFFLTKLSY